MSETTMAAYTPTEMMTIAAARALRNDDVCFVGIGQPSAACNLARLTHAPGITLIYESGTIDTKPKCCRCRSATANCARRR
jgi:glutaconate CoA-transferase subunit B